MDRFHLTVIVLKDTNLSMYEVIIFICRRNFVDYLVGGYTRNYVVGNDSWNK
jgi:hypothetical protein